MTSKFAASFLIIAIMAFAPGAFALGVNDKAPDFTLKNLDGKKVTLSDLIKDKAVMIVFWATWCPNCEREIPAIKRVKAELGGEVEALAINADINDSLSRALAYKTRHSIDYTILYDAGSKVARRYAVMGVPTVFIVSKKGIIKYRGGLVPDIDEMKTRMNELKN